jgi:hypothetical protein
MPGILSRFSESDRSSAQRTTRIAQGFFGVALLAVGGLAAATFWHSTPTADSTTLTVPDLPPDPSLLQTSYVAAGIDVAATDTAVRWNMVKNRPIPVEPTETSGTQPTPTDPNTPAPAPTGLAERIRFLGVIREPNRLLALISIEGKQRIVAVGETFTLTPGDTTQIKVVRISTDELVVTDGSEHTIKKGVRSGLAIGSAPEDLAAAAGAPAADSHMLPPGVTTNPGMTYPPYTTGPGGTVSGNTAIVRDPSYLIEKERKLEQDRLQEESRVRDDKMREAGKEIPIPKEPQR